MGNDIVLAKLSQQVNSDIPLTRISIYQVIASALYYNPQLQLMELENRGVTQHLLSQWLKDLNKMDRWLSKKLTVIGLLSILQLPFSMIPSSVSGSIPQLLSAVVPMIADIKEENKEDAEDVDDDDEFEGYDENEDVINDEVNETFNTLKKFSNADDLARFLVGEDWFDDDEEEDEYTSPIDDIDHLQFFSDTLKAAFQREPEVYQQIQAALTAETVNTCHKLLLAANEQRVNTQTKEGK